MVVKKLCIDHKPNFLLVVESWIKIEQIQDRFWSSLNLKPFVVNEIGSLIPKLWCLCPNNLTPRLINSSKKQISFTVQFENQNIFISAIYAWCSYLQRRTLWEELATLQQNHHGPWCLLVTSMLYLELMKWEEATYLPGAPVKNLGHGLNCNLIHLPTRLLVEI